jgi:hypothetical protein
MMQAIEFETVVTNRNISLPEKYILDNQKVRVIVLYELESKNQETKHVQKPISIIVKGE